MTSGIGGLGSAQMIEMYPPDNFNASEDEFFRKDTSVERAKELLSTLIRNENSVVYVEGGILNVDCGSIDPRHIHKSAFVALLSYYNEDAGIKTIRFANREFSSDYISSDLLDTFKRPCSLDFDDCDLQTYHVRFLETLKRCISGLGIRSQPTEGADFFNALAKFIAYNETLLDLNLSSIDMTDQEFQVIADALPFNSKLKSLILANNPELSDVAALELSFRLRTHPNLAAVSLKSTKITNVGLRAIAQASHDRRNVVYMDIGVEKTKVDDKGVSYLLNTALNIKKLGLAGSEVRKTGTVIEAARHIYLELISFGENIRLHKVANALTNRFDKRKREQPLLIHLPSQTLIYDGINMSVEGLEEEVPSAKAVKVSHGMSKTLEAIAELEKMLHEQKDPGPEVLAKIATLPSATQAFYYGVYFQAKFSDGNNPTQKDLEKMIVTTLEKTRNDLFIKFLSRQFEFVHVPYDGNCLYKAVYEGIIRSSEGVFKTLVKAFMPSEENLENTTGEMILRLMTTKYMKDNPENFKYFITPETFEEFTQFLEIKDVPDTDVLEKMNNDDLFALYLKYNVRPRFWGGEQEISAILGIFKALKAPFELVIYDITSHPEIKDGKVEMPEMMHRVNDALDKDAERTIIHLFRRNENHYELLLPKKPLEAQALEPIAK